MRIRIAGAGFYGCHLAVSLLADGHDVEVFEAGDDVFTGASGNCPARLHLGPTHYPRSAATQEACRAHGPLFMERYGFLTRNVPICIYAVAADDSLVDFGAYRRALRDIEFITVHDPAEYGLQNIEGAVLTGERHVVTDWAAAWFRSELEGHIRFRSRVDRRDDPRWDLTIDTTFCAGDATGIDRYEPCLTVLLEGDADRSVTVMDGPFCGVYVWNEDRRLSSLTSAVLTPFSKTCRTYAEAEAILRGLTKADLVARGTAMMDQMAGFWPEVRERYRIADYRLAIRAMPRSGADSRLVAVRRTGYRSISVRAGKIDAVIEAERVIRDML